MPVVDINGYEVQFPFEPYDVQKALMGKVLECLTQRQHGLLESPTGTGKTLSLLCSAIAWQRKQKTVGGQPVATPFDLRADVARALQGLPPPPAPTGRGFKKSKNAANQDGFAAPKIVYASRTHSQLSQAVQELRRSFYKDTKAIVLGSRDMLCVHDEVTRLENSAAKIMGCQIKVRNHSCHFYNNVNREREECATKENGPVDIEDLVAKGRANRFCPFFMSREFVSEADVVFMPYNYLLDPKLRSSHGLDLRNCVIILDEGHNIAKICEDAVSFEIKSTLVANCIQEVTRAFNEFNQYSNEMGSMMTKDLSVGILVNLKKAFLDLEEGLEKFQISKEGEVLSGSELLKTIYSNGFPPTALPKLAADLDAVSTFLSSTSLVSTACDNFGSILRVLASQTTFRNPELFGHAFKVLVQEEETKRNRNDIRSYDPKHGTKAKLFNVWCFNPAVGLETMLTHGPRCIILASGTLAPMAFLAKELQQPFPVQLSNPHIIKDNQLLARVVPVGPGNVRLSSSYQNRNNLNYLKSLGEAIVKICTVVSRGVLVFFPSYVVMEICRKEWEQNGIWAALCGVKKVLFEPRGKDAFQKTMEEYYANVRVANGACLMAVCRGKVSEGLDFTDDNGRAVIVTGIPYAPSKDPHVLAKQKYLNDQVERKEMHSMPGYQWYQLDATRALNQAIGRIIRHVADYGAILICDERCASASFQTNLSQWVAQRLQVANNFDNVMKDLETFFGASVQKERAEYAKSLFLNVHSGHTTHRTHDEMLAAADRSILQQVQASTVSAQELEDLYGPTECVQEFSAGKAAAMFTQRPSPCLKKTSKSKGSASTLFGDLMASSSTTSKANFHAPVPVYPKPFVAFNQSSPEVKIHQPKKKIRLASNNVSYSSTVFEKPVASSHPEEEPEMSEAEFWDWIKTTLPASNLPAFVRALKKYRETKNVSGLGTCVRTLFPASQHRKLGKGLEKIIPAKDLESLRSYLVMT